MQVEGIPEGWELVRIGRVKRGEFRLSNFGQVIEWQDNSESGHSNYVVIRKIEKPKRYRPFANAAEFEPHRDRWIRRSRTGSDTAGCFRVHAYNDTEIWDSWSKQTYHQMFHDGRQFADGTPFGVEVIDD